MDTGCGSVGRKVTCDTRGPRFQSSHRQILLKTYLLLTVEKTKIKKKWLRIAHLKKSLLKKWKRNVFKLFENLFWVTILSMKLVIEVFADLTSLIFAPHLFRELATPSDPAHLREVWREDLFFNRETNCLTFSLETTIGEREIQRVFCRGKKGSKKKGWKWNADMWRTKAAYVLNVRRHWPLFAHFQSF